MSANEETQKMKEHFTTEFNEKQKAWGTRTIKRPDILEYRDGPIPSLQKYIDDLEKYCTSLELQLKQKAIQKRVKELEKEK